MIMKVPVVSLIPIFLLGGHVMKLPIRKVSVDMKLLAETVGSLSNSLLHCT